MTEVNEEITALVEILKEDGYICSSDKEWKTIRSDVEDYDEGRLTTSYVVQNVASGRFYGYTLDSNSWDDSGEDYNEYEVDEVFPTQVTVTQYLVKK